MKFWRGIVSAAAAISVGAALSASAQMIDTPAEFAVIMDHETGQILYSKRGDELMTPASMTKMMTAFVVFELIERGEISLTDKFTVSEDAWRRGGFPSGTSTMGLKPKDTPTVEELLHGVITMSGNDACIVLAEGISGSEPAFSARMTEIAHELGLSSVNFVNSTGLEGEGHVVSAIDLAKLAKMTIDKYPQYYSWYSLPSYTWRDYTQANRNPLLEVAGADGLKTGHLESSGYGLTASAVRDGVRRTIVINGLPTMAARAQEAERLMRVAIQSFELKTIGPETVTLPDVQVWLGAQTTVPVSLAEPVKVVGHKAAFSKAKAELVLDKTVRAPVKKGDVVGTFVVTLDGQEPVTAPVIAEADVKKLGFVGQAIAGIGTLMKGESKPDAEEELKGG
ncbi:D-alanyl-D-alanine carboxypeptidase family protein [Hyphomonas sp.]|uniref:D-alanyl-D-alanine carboxypeptidase family protein n=1 Tax=Hyphomonas sp. TaxID=87 RepID=UPI0025BFEB90|nr:D-alanyl-D-alanine carboxypeptidase family protein [Hyphomonas sp.]